MIDSFLLIAGTITCLGFVVYYVEGAMWLARAYRIPVEWNATIWVDSQKSYVHIPSEMKRAGFNRSKFIRLAEMPPFFNGGKTYQLAVDPAVGQAVKLYVSNNGYAEMSLAEFLYRTVNR
jgi:hypothetical protein